MNFELGIEGSKPIHCNEDRLEDGYNTTKTLVKYGTVKVEVYLNNRHLKTFVNNRLNGISTNCLIM